MRSLSLSLSLSLWRFLNDAFSASVQQDMIMSSQASQSLQGGPERRQKRPHLEERMLPSNPTVALTVSMSLRYKEQGVSSVECLAASVIQSLHQSATKLHHAWQAWLSPVPPANDSSRRGVSKDLCHGEALEEKKISLLSKHCS